MDLPVLIVIKDAATTSNLLLEKRVNLLLMVDSIQVRKAFKILTYLFSKKKMGKRS
uniref:Uncharacterized protein n=1 Tax=Medicago truncatula TaxID=3880 RepID=I3SI83_MEDTR|nr:unknown [Medicago truncatula]